MLRFTMHCKVFGFWIFRAGKRSRSAAAHGTNKQPPRRPLIVAGRSVDQTCTHKYHHWGYAIDAVAVFKIEHRPLLLSHLDASQKALCIRM